MIKKKNENLQPASAENKKKFLKGLKKGVACFLLGAGILGLGHTASQQIKYRAFFNDLTTNEQMTDLAIKMGINQEIANLESPRVVFPRNGVLTINVKLPEKRQTPQVKELLQKNVDEINRAFEYVNPKYSVKLEYDPKNFKNMYYIDLYDSIIFADYSSGAHQYSKLHSTASNGVGAYGSKVGINFSKLYINYGSDTHFEEAFSNTFMREVLGHAIAGMKDTNTQDSSNSDQSIMNENRDAGLNSILPSELNVLQVKYGKDTDYDKWNEMASEYFNTSDWYLSKLKQVKYLKENYLSVLSNYYFGFNYSTDKNDFQIENLGEFYFTVNKLELKENGNQEKYFTAATYINHSKGNFENTKYHSTLYNFFEDTIDCVEQTATDCDIDGVRYSYLNDSYLIKYKDMIYEFSVSSDGNNKYKVESKPKCYNIISREEYDNMLLSEKYERINTIMYRYSHKGRYFDRLYYEMAGAYCYSQGYDVAKLPDLKGLSISANIIGYDTYMFGNDDNTLTIASTDSSGQTTNSNFRYKVFGKYVLCSNGDIIMNTQKGLKVMKTAFDFNEKMITQMHCADIIESSINYDNKKVDNTKIESNNKHSIL